MKAIGSIQVIKLILLLFILICTVFWSLSVGVTPISLRKTIKIFTTPFLFLLGFPVQIDFSQTEMTILLQIRLPRVICAILVGSALASAGAVFQALLRNPLADPFVLGVSSGAAFGAIIAILFNIPVYFISKYSAIPTFGFIGSLITILLVLFIAKTSSGHLPIFNMLITGVMINGFLFALIMFLISVFNPIQAPQVLLWLLGSLENLNIRLLLFGTLYFIIGWSIIFLYSRYLNVLTLGDETALQLGVEVEKTKKIIFVFTSLLVGATVSISGIIGFVGLIIPHFVRTYISSDHRVLLPASALSGAIFLLIADSLARLIIAPAEIPVGVVTALAGSPFFLYLLRKKKMRFY